MNFLSLIKRLFGTVENVDTNIKSKFRFTQSELNEITLASKKENLKYLEALAKISGLDYFDICFLLAKTDLNEEKIEIIKKAQKIYNEDEFKEYGQTRHDFIFKVASNLEYLNMNNLEVFKEIAKLKNDIYDFSKALENPARYLVKKEAKMGYAFVHIYY